MIGTLDTIDGTLVLSNCVGILELSDNKIGSQILNDSQYSHLMLSTGIYREAMSYLTQVTGFVLEMIQYGLD